MDTDVVGIGQEVAGDDGVGLAVLEELGRRSLPRGTQLLRLAAPTELVALLERGRRVVLVDAVLAAPAGLVLELEPEALSQRAPQPTSSHGFSVAQAIELARALAPDGASPCVRIVAITIAPPGRYRVGLSPEVADAVPEAAARVLALLEVDRA